MPSKLGLIIEDESDSEVIIEIIRKIRPGSRVAIQPVLAGGCARIRAKSGAWAKNLAAKGCNLLVVVHDCDRYDENELREQLDGMLIDSAIAARIVIIPVEEIETWLLADSEAIRRAMNLKKAPKKLPTPHSIKSPKEFLERLVFSHSNKEKRYVNTRHNGRIAKLLSLAEVRRCPSFPAFEAFIRQNVV